MTESIFTKIINRQIPADILYESERIIAIRDINPQAPTHILVIPKIPIANMSQLESKDVHILSEIFVAINKIAKEEGIYESGYRIVVNKGRDAGETVPHLHFHLLGGRSLNWPPG